MSLLKWILLLFPAGKYYRQLVSCGESIVSEKNFPTPVFFSNHPLATKSKESLKNIWERNIFLPENIAFLLVAYSTIYCPVKNQRHILLFHRLDKTCPRKLTNQNHVFQKYNTFQTVHLFVGNLSNSKLNLFF